MGIKINTILCNPYNYNSKQTRPTSSIKYIVIHFTANNGDTAKGNANYFRNNILKNPASAHLFVDENSVYRSIPDNHSAYHCGTSGTYYHPTCRNKNSIGVELCSRIKGGKYYFKDKTITNAVILVKELMNRYNIPVKNVIRHYDVTHKRCPIPFIDNPTAWNNFKQQLSSKEPVKPTTQTKTLTSVNDIVYRLGPNSQKILSDTGYWTKRIGEDKNILALAKNAANYTLNNKKGTSSKILSEANDIAYRLKASGIIADSNYWLDRMSNDTVLLSLCRNIANWIL